MTTETEYRALLEQALEALSCDGGDDDPGHRCSHCDDYVDRNGGVRAALRAELAKPPTTPAWHDAPTCAGLWMCEYRNSFSAFVLSDYGVKKFDANEMAYCRWYGPIPQDAKAEGEST